MKRKIQSVYLAFILSFWGLIGFSSCEALDNVLNQMGSGLTSEEIVNGLRTALDLSSKESATSASKVNGFLKNALISIPLPEEIQQLQDFAQSFNPSNELQSAGKFALQLFASQQFEDLRVSINRAAEQASTKAYGIFKDAIVNMTIADGLQILQGGEKAATNYLKQKTEQSLIQAFKPIVQTVIKDGQVSRLWSNIAPRYNGAAPFARQFGFLGPERVNPDLSEYVTEQALNGLFVLVGNEEAKIRANPAGYAQEIIQKVFGSPEAKAKR